jgi:hypothetical protein
VEYKKLEKWIRKEGFFCVVKERIEIVMGQT